jgi:AraC-like DNA-binding protein
MKQNKFDLVMDYIDENIKKDTEEIKRGILNLIGINSTTFGKYFTVLTEDTLGSYIRSRRLYYAAKELQSAPEKSICDIALDYGYSEQSAFTRAFTTKFGFSPGDLRQKNVYHFIANDKYLYEDFNPQAPESRSDHIWREFERTGWMGGDDLAFIESVEAGQREFGFDIDTSYTIADLAERLDVPVFALMRACFNLIAEVQSDPHYIPKKAMAAMSLGLHCEEDLDEICEYYACEYYELNSHMVCEWIRTQGEEILK